jgi:small subunit ribosomal protein S6e
MPVLVVSDPETGKSQRVELEAARMAPLVGRRIGEVMDGTVANMPGHKLKLTGGTDKDGIPMRPDVHGSAKADIILSGGVGYKPKNKGERKRVMVRGNTVSTETTFLNLVIVERPKGRKKAEEPKPEEPKPEEPKPEKAPEEEKEE